jgi:hypothetical protein
MFKKSITFNLLLIVCIVINVATFPSVFADTTKTKQAQVPFGNDEQEFIFAGSCPYGGTYRIHSYQMEVDGLTQSFYDYEGPAGKGTVRTNAAPKKMVVRVCNELAELADGSKYD